MNGHGQRAARRACQVARVARRQHVNRPGAEFDGIRRRCIARYAAVDELVTADVNGRKHARIAALAITVGWAKPRDSRRSIPLRASVAIT